ncbi:hypothetical protein [Lacticaseibacillus porcinae]|uniref:hypothetical protein n=1 Tax=Lacticaseibacillus porcinae TaxID=1123687 RepID=UPI000F7A06B4|nr:hypothetical protein [Lacticaseibacillus porcinae]
MVRGPTILIRGMLFAGRHWHLLLPDGEILEGNFLLVAVDQLETKSRIRIPPPKQIVALLVNQHLLWPPKQGDPDAVEDQRFRPVQHPLRWSDDVEAQGNLIQAYWFEDPAMRQQASKDRQQRRDLVANSFAAWRRDHDHRYQGIAPILSSLAKLNDDYRQGSIDEFEFERRGLRLVTLRAKPMLRDFKWLLYQRRRLLKRDAPDFSTLPKLWIMTDIVAIHPNSQTPTYPQSDYDYAQASDLNYQQAMYQEFLASEQFRLNQGLDLEKKFINPQVRVADRWTLEEIRQWLLAH